MSLLKVDPLPAYKYFSVHPSLSVEAALGMAASVNHSLADPLNLYLLQPDGEFTNLAALELAARCAAELIDASVSALQKDREEGGGSMKTSIKVDPCTPMGSFRIYPNTSVDEALREAERLINSIQFLFSDLDGDPLEPGVHFGIEFLARCAAELVDSARRGVVRHEGGGIRMNLGHVIRKKCKRDADEVLNADQIGEIKQDLNTARDAIYNISLGVAAIGALIATAATEGELGQETAGRLGWLLEELGGGIYGLLDFEMACTERLRAQGGRKE